MASSRGPFGDECDAAWLRCGAQCSRYVFGSVEAVQPRFAVEQQSVCGACASLLPAGLAESATPVPFACAAAVVEEALGLKAGAALPAGAVLPAGDGDCAAVREGAYRAAVSSAPRAGTDASKLRSVIESAIRTRRSHEDAAALAAARAAVPVAALQLRAGAAVLGTAFDAETFDAATLYDAASGLPVDALLHAAIKWRESRVRHTRRRFKTEFFTWFKKPKSCSQCGCTKGDNMDLYATDAPNAHETSFGWASRVEVYKCALCAGNTRFARMNNPVALLESRTGRCGEFANCFTLVCRALGFEARYVYDTTDHVWVEAWSFEQKRWLHADSCEAKVDAPRLYEQGWGKKLAFILAVDRGEVVDVTRRYARKDAGAILLRRNETFGGVTERRIAKEIADCDSKQRAWGAAQTPPATDRLWAASFSARREDELRELAEAAWAQEKAVANADEGEGRQNGDAAWINARGEGGGTAPGTEALPGGSWAQSSQNARVDGAVLTADLRNCEGAWISTSTPCLAGEEFDNMDGSFRKTRVGAACAADLEAKAAALAAAARREPALAAERRRRHRSVVSNIVDKPDDARCRAFRLANAVVADKLLFSRNDAAALAWFAAVGFKPDGDALKIAEDRHLEVAAALLALDKAWAAD